MKSLKRQIQKENTRKKIIETAYRIFSEKGFSVATSVIAKEAGVSHGSIFVHFPTLNDLLVCLVSEFGDKMGESLHLLAKKDSIENLLAEHLNVLEEYEAFYFRLISEINLLPNEAKSTFVIIQSKVAFHFSNIMEREIKKGVIKKLPTHMMFNTWIGLVHYYMLNKEFFSRPNESVLHRYKGELLSNYMNLINRESEV
ncbi:MAG: TetR/AcrR family transcriptional regulator [Herbinix sp.]|nr:TetR/AcrR family transcriptional regulator [Herbinix sp.]